MTFPWFARSALRWRSTREHAIAALRRSFVCPIADAFAASRGARLRGLGARS